MTERAKTQSSRRHRKGRPRLRPRHELEVLLAESEQRHRQLLDMASDWFWETDAEGFFTFISPNIEKALNRASSSYLGKPLSEAEVLSYDPAEGRATLEKFKARQPYRDFVYARKLDNGKTAWISASGAPRYDRD